MSSSALQPPGENKPRPQLSCKVSGIVYLWSSCLEGRTVVKMLILLCFSAPTACVLLPSTSGDFFHSFKDAIMRPSTVKLNKHQEVDPVRVSKRPPTFVLQALPQGNPEDVQRWGSEPTHCLLAGSAGPHLLRTGKPQSKDHKELGLESSMAD